MGDRACAATCVLVCLARARPLPAQLSLLCCAHFTGLEAGTLGCRTSFWGWESRQGWLAQGSYQGGDAQRLLCPGAWDQPGRAVLPTIFLPLSPPLAVTPLPLTAPQLEHDPSSRAFSSQTLALFQEAFWSGPVGPPVSSLWETGRQVNWGRGWAARRGKPRGPPCTPGPCVCSLPLWRHRLAPVLLFLGCGEPWGSART